MTIALLFILNLSLFTRDRREVERSPAHRADGVSWVLLVTGSAVFLAGVLAIGILESHRTAGAAYSIRRAVDQLREGRRGVRVRLRRRDNLQDLARSINELAEVLDNERPPRS